MVAPAYGSTGTEASGTGNITVTKPSGAGSNDLLIAVLISANETLPDPPSPWKEVLAGQQGTGAAGGANAVNMRVFYGRAADVADIPVTDPGNHAYGVIHRYTHGSGTPVVTASAGNVASTASASVAFPAIAAGQADSRVLNIHANSRDSTGSAMSSLTNADLTSLGNNFTGGTASGNGSNHGIASGTKASAGSVAGTTASIGSAFVQANITICLGPPGSTAEDAGTPTANPDNSTHAHSSTSPSLAGKSSVTPDNSAYAHSSSSPSLAAKSAVTPDASTWGHSSTSPSLAAKSAVTPDDSVHGHASSSPTIGSGIVSVLPDASIWAHSSTSPTLAAKSVVTAEASNHAHLSSSPALAARSAVTPTGSIWGHASTSPSLLARSTLVPHDSVHLHFSTDPTLHAVAPGDAFYVGKLAPEELFAGTLTAADYYVGKGSYF